MMSLGSDTQDVGRGTCNLKCHFVPSGNLHLVGDPDKSSEHLKAGQGHGFRCLLVLGGMSPNMAYNYSYATYDPILITKP